MIQNNTETESGENQLCKELGIHSNIVTGMKA